MLATRPPPGPALSAKGTSRGVLSRLVRGANATPACTLVTEQTASRQTTQNRSRRRTAHRPQRQRSRRAQPDNDLFWPAPCALYQSRLARSLGSRGSRRGGMRLRASQKEVQQFRHPCSSMLRAIAATRQREARVIRGRAEATTAVAAASPSRSCGHSGCGRPRWRRRRASGRDRL